MKECRDCRMLREKVSSLEAKNEKFKSFIKEKYEEEREQLVNLKKKTKRPSIPDSEALSAIEKINDFCKQKNVGLKINANGLISRLTKYDSKYTPEEESMRDLNIKIDAKIPETFTLSQTCELIGKLQNIVGSKANIDWTVNPQIEPTAEDANSLLSLGLRDKIQGKVNFGDKVKKKRRIK